MSNETSKTTTFWSRLGWAFVKLLRLLLILALIAGIAAAVYFGTPYVYDRFILPVENNTARLQEVESKQAAEVKQLADQLTDLKSRLADLETSQTENARAVAELQGQLAALETAVDSHTETLKKLDSIQKSLDGLAAISAEHQTLLVGNDSVLADLQRQVTVGRAIELLSRARLYLSQSNFGLAEGDIQSARSLLAGLQDEIPVEDAAALQSVIARLDLASGNLPAFPVVAADDLNTAWQLLIDNLPDQPQGTPIPEPISVTPTPTVWVTPTVAP